MEQAGTCHLCRQIFEGPSDSPAGLCDMGASSEGLKAKSEGKGCAGNVKGLRGGLENHGNPILQGHMLGWFSSSQSQSI